MKRVKLQPFTAEHFQEWAKKLELDNGEQWVVDDYFLLYLKDVFEGFRQKGLWKLWLMVPEGNGKTTNLAGLALYHCAHYPNAFVPWAAAVRQQAEIGYRQAKLFTDSMPKALRPRCYDGYRRIQFQNGSRIDIYAADAASGDGPIPTLPIIDELHRHKDMNLYRTWAGKLRKRNAQMLVISTAGEPGSDFERTREKIKSEASKVQDEGAYVRCATERVIMHEYAVREDKILDMEMVKAANPASWIDEKYLTEKQSDPDMTEAHWRRFTCNLATMDEGKEPYIDLQDWDALADSDTEIPVGAAVCLGADGSRTWDTTVIAWAWPDNDGVVHVDGRVFSVRNEVDCHVLHRGGKIDFDDVEAFILDRFDQFDVVGVAYDPRYLERSMDIVQMRLPDSSVHAVEPSSKNMRDALQSMFNLAAEGKLRHRGDKVIRQHIANTGVERGFGSELRRVRKVDSRLPIDAVPAMALAVWRATQDEASAYKERGLAMVG